MCCSSTGAAVPLVANFLEANQADLREAGFLGADPEHRQDLVALALASTHCVVGPDLGSKHYLAALALGDMYYLVALALGHTNHLVVLGLEHIGYCLAALAPVPALAVGHTYYSGALETEGHKSCSDDPCLGGVVMGVVEDAGGDDVETGIPDAGKAGEAGVT